MNCKTCNFALEPGQEICPICGTKVENNSAPSLTPEVEEAPVTEVVETVEPVSVLKVQEPELPSVEPVSVLPEEPVVEPVPVLEVQEPELPSVEPVSVLPEEPVVEPVPVLEVQEPESPSVEPVSVLPEEPVVEPVPVLEVQEPESPPVEPVSVLPEEPVVEPVPVLEVQEPLPSTEPVAMFPEEQSTPDPLTTPEEPVVDEISQNDLQALEQSVLPDNNLGTAEPVEPVIPVMENTLEPNANMTNEALVSGKKKKRLPIVSIIIGVIVVVLAGLAGYLAYNKFVGQKQTAIFNNYEYTINGKYNVKKFDNTRLLIMDDKEEAKATWIITIMPYTDYETFADVKSNAENVNTNLTKLGYMIDNTEYTTINGTDVFIATVKKDDRTFQEIILPNKSGSLLQANISQKDGSTSEVHLNTLINIVNTSVKK